VILPDGTSFGPIQRSAWKGYSPKFKQLLSTNEGRSLVTPAKPGRPRPYTTSCLDPSVPGGDLILCKDGRGAYDSLSEGHHRLVERAHYDVA
jgi:hypothetical protein